MSWWGGPGVGFVYAVIEEGSGEGWEGESLCGEVWDGGKWACRFQFPSRFPLCFVIQYLDVSSILPECVFGGVSADLAAAVC